MYLIRELFAKSVTLWLFFVNTINKFFMAQRLCSVKVATSSPVSVKLTRTKSVRTLLCVVIDATPNFYNFIPKSYFSIDKSLIVKQGLFEPLKQ